MASNRGAVRTHSSIDEPTAKASAVPKAALGRPDVGCARIDVDILHHLDDRQARKFFARAHAVLRPGGRLITADGSYTPEQSRLARFVLARDRGRYLRTREAYV